MYEKRYNLLLNYCVAENNNKNVRIWGVSQMVDPAMGFGELPHAVMVEMIDSMCAQLERHTHAPSTWSWSTPLTESETVRRGGLFYYLNSHFPRYISRYFSFDFLSRCNLLGFSSGCLRFLLSLTLNYSCILMLYRMTRAWF